MRVLALDIGERRVGVAISDPSGSVASPLQVIDTPERLGDSVAGLIDEYNVGLLVVGLPLTLRGEEGPQARRVRQVAERVAERANVPLVYQDERLSSAEANRVMSGYSARRRRGSVDKVAAAIFLQSFLDSGGARTPGTNSGVTDDS